MNPALTQNNESERLLATFAELHPRRIDLSLTRIQRLLKSLGNPEKELPPVVQIAGTNGKGSCLAFLQAIANAYGWNCDSYTSPHLVRFNERIQLANQPISEQNLNHALREAERANNSHPITYFEITTAAAFLAFAKAHARKRRNLLLLEVGLGGRLDATSVVPSVALSIITSISLDHQAFLGSSLSAIAYEKAGIIRSQTPIVSSPQRPAAARVIAKRAAQCNAPLLLGERDWSCEKKGETGGRNRFSLHCKAFPELAQQNWQANLLGAHQAVNAATSLVAARWLGADLDSCTRGLSQTHWPARLQKLKNVPLAQHAGSNLSLWLDGAHNPDAARALTQAMAQLPASLAPWSFIVSMIASKRCAAFLRALATIKETTKETTGAAAGNRENLLVAIPAPADHIGVAPQKLAKLAREAGFHASEASGTEEAIDRIALHHHSHMTRNNITKSTAKGVMICGSLYLAGTILNANANPP
ncbi:MAG: Mur ligase family protein [Alphaproteobacteria bacterium]